MAKQSIILFENYFNNNIMDGSKSPSVVSESSTGHKNKVLDEQTKGDGYKMPYVKGEVLYK